ncbi:hypothetical protein NP493_272g00007 [Ridgeia piscesae]|uniref:Uncharacterized protein n=1 Tax=Ridgeia piscesae TaxID=27915 RepID=A0AAD9NXJ9_RIDPI|nr:hypothetical protein NP493_272g00007 [Ridgeia piscesae]
MPPHRYFLHKHIYMLHSCSCAFVSSLFPREYVKTPLRIHHFEGNFFN